MMMPCTDTLKPWERPLRPSDLKILVRQSPRPLNSRPAPALPTSAARRVRAKSSGYTKHRKVAPAAPPDARFPAKYRQNWARLSTPSRKIFLYLSLKAKLRAWVGKYLMTLARFPLQKERKPCSLGIRTTQSMMPLYCMSALICLLACCTWRRSLTLSMGATAVLEMAAEMPPAKKSLAKEMAVSFPDIFVGF